MSSKVLFTAASYADRGELSYLSTIHEALDDDCSTAQDLSLISLLEDLTVSTCDNMLSEIDCDEDSLETPSDVKTVCSSGDESSMFFSDSSATEFEDEEGAECNLKTCIYNSDVSLNTANNFSIHTAAMSVNADLATNNHQKGFAQPTRGTNSYYQLAVLNESPANPPRNNFVTSFYQAAELRDNMGVPQQQSSFARPSAPWAGETRHGLWPTTHAGGATCAANSDRLAPRYGEMDDDGGMAKAVNSEYCYGYSYMY